MRNTIVWLTLFGISMGFLETSVVVYLREILYPNGFDFPLSMFPKHLALTEILREAATVIMLVAVGIFTGRTRTEKFGFFIFTFAVWDIFYYVFLKALLNWPESLLTWDILFLIPNYMGRSRNSASNYSLTYDCACLAYFKSNNKKQQSNN
jgi:hypothetical protein